MQPIVMTTELANKMANEFYASLMKMGKINKKQANFTYSFETLNPNAVNVNFTVEAYEQMFALVNYFDCEVAWHGYVHRIDDTHFQITKILLYPQDVDDVTVTTDQAGYSVWLNDRSDEEFNSIRFQGHSHVDMPTNPSNLDELKQWDIIKDLDADDFYIFIIVNKRHEYNVWVVDKAKNVIYTDKDVNITVGSFDKNEFLKDADVLVKKVVHTAAYQAATKNKKTSGTLKGAKKSGSNLVNYYRDYPEQLDNGNSSCLPYEEAINN